MEYDEAHIQAVLDFWKDVLCVQHWVIDWKIVDDTKLKNALMEIRPTSIRNHAIIFIRTSTVRISTHRAFEKLLVHELVHLLYDPLSEEHKLELEYTDCSPTRQKEYRARFIVILEKAVEHTAQLLTANRSFDKN